MFVVFYGALFSANLYFQNVLHLSALTAGLFLLPAGVPVFALPILVSRVAKKFTPASLVAVGTLVSTIGVAAVSLAPVISSPWLIAGSLLIVGIGFGIASPPHLNLATAVAPAGTAGVISALANAGRQAGYLLGVATVGSAGNDVAGLSQATSFAVAGGVLALIALGIAQMLEQRATTEAVAKAS